MMNSKQLFGSKLNRNIIIVSSMFSIGLWFLLGDVSDQTVGFVRTGMMFSVIGVSGIIIAIIKTHNIGRFGNIYGFITSAFCFIVFIAWLSYAIKIAVTLSFIMMGFILVTYAEIVKRIYNS